jgi:DNA repair exonuclease SbcCD ATPase subunit
MPALNHEDYESTQKKQLNALSIQLEKLRSEQNIKKSFFSKIATWYSERHFLTKLGVGLLFTGVGAFVSVLLLIPYPAFGALIGLAAYLFPSMIFAQHHSAEKKFQKSVSAEILNLEKVMKKSMASFQAITTQMKKTLVSLEEKNKEQEKNILDLKTAVSSFEEQVKKSDDVLHKLQENQALCGNNSQLLSNTIIRATSAHEHFDRSQRELSKINKGLTQTQEKLQQGTQVFEDLSQHVSKSTASLDTLGKTFEELEKTATANNQKIEKHLAELQQKSQSRYTETPEEQEESSASLQEKTLENVRRLFASTASSHRLFPLENKQAGNVAPLVQISPQSQIH